MPLRLLHHDMLIAGIIAGIIAGFGLGIVFRFGGTSGGSDVVARIVEQNLAFLSDGQCLSRCLCFTVITCLY